MASISKVRFIGDGKDLILTGHSKLFCPIIETVGMRSLGDVLFWERCINSMHDFAYEFDRRPLEMVANAIDIARDHFTKEEAELYNRYEGGEERTDHGVDQGG